MQQSINNRCLPWKLVGMNIEFEDNRHQRWQAPSARATALNPKQGIHHGTLGHRMIEHMHLKLQLVKYTRNWVGDS
jgi:hypothetical protein